MHATPSNRPARVHPGRAAGRDRDHRADQRRGPADGPAGAERAAGERGGPGPPGDPGRHPRRRHPGQRPPGHPAPARPDLQRPDTPAAPSALASNRIVPIEPAPDYTEGLVAIVVTARPSLPATYSRHSVSRAPAAQISGSMSVTTVDSVNTILSNPTSWYWNIRQGDKIRFNDSGPYYTIAGPDDRSARSQRRRPHEQSRAVHQQRPAAPRRSPGPSAEYLILVNGHRRRRQRLHRRVFDGLDNDGDGIVDPLLQRARRRRRRRHRQRVPRDRHGEYETEKFVGSLASPRSTRRPT